MLNLRKNKTYIITLLEGLKFLKKKRSVWTNNWRKLSLNKKMTIKFANEMSFEEKVSFALEDLNSFSSSCKEIHDASRCYLDPCFIKFFCDELFFIHKKTIMYILST